MNADADVAALDRQKLRCAVAHVAHDHMLEMHRATEIMLVAGQQDLRAAGPAHQGERPGASRMLVEPLRRLVRGIGVGTRRAALRLDRLALHHAEVRARQDGEDRLRWIVQHDIDRLRIDHVHRRDIGDVLRRLVLHVDQPIERPFHIVGGDRIAAVEFRVAPGGSASPCRPAVCSHVLASAGFTSR